ncbi:MAG: bifunctional D-glycero-beta-D-manno-heptose-7-phosphate kinase/D-glycero-beta-D-manno-heptose 1-phosphate adenylyltransferase HldE [Gammaproteobacteria bacterium]|nr:bifunctional heptose 7-phosphate kinase/heptose 1-phosphate adenyltransferase [Gammaproteobacteria bacterium]MDP6097428.1 bifunctional D-glycero-beta-D-manno-heptose-7-phosphate kinase/D-glycero-beta-D-manno-heptose 1-phosphate adenylyltransferase HldE [Gammaproteobacteria bacterium]MDP7455321.1 bifunctional D-glycero-beta-D-manno-heptose-7-phosphate kinase/D-glycero-beta-D-manno-heptose 1-phosphate adenylyltransferase HldE [Gammaproteobacteria bacterium]HJO12721.1 bifunctional D-glycero-beta|tara:strand:- start:460 stop:1890 length:1431 start_codon:yes stop_codon:yes gene_type:complete
MRLEMPPFQQSRILVVGDVMLDRYWHGQASRVSPEAPVPVVQVGNREDRPGGAGNVALNIAALGSAATLVGIIGRDETGEELQSRLNAAGVYCDFLLSDDKPTITKLRVISQHQQLIRLDFEQMFGGSELAGLVPKVESLLDGNQALILSDYGKGALDGISNLIELAHTRNIPIVVDPKGSDFEKYRGATIVTPNLNEFESAVGHCANEEELVRRGLALLAELELQALLITRGEHGMTLLRPDSAELHLPAQAQEVFDVTGAGDTVISVLAASLASGDSLAESTALANLAAGLVVGKLGTAAISGPELRRAMLEEQGSGRGIMSSDQLQIAVQDAREHGEKIVFTNGCFDIIHAGHVGYLSEAKQFGNRLIVAINEDLSVRRLKGAGRPINPLERRMAVLAGLEAVDWVVSFAEDTPENLLEVLRPEVLVKGGDYSLEQVVGGSFVQDYGGEVKVLEFLDDCSTSAMMEKMQEVGD